MSNTTRAAQERASSMQRQQSDPTRTTDDAISRFLGTWRLVGFSRKGRPHPAFGAAPVGTIRYEADGNMAVQIMPDAARHPEVSAAAPAEVSAIPGYIAYFGAYRIDPRARTVAHDRVGNVSQGEPRKVVRHYEFLPGGRLALTLAEDPEAQVLWERVH